MVEQKYVDKKKVDPKKMYYGAIKGLVASLEDPYTFFLTPVENQQSKDGLEGKFEGIGAQLGMKDNRVVVIAPLKNSPAEKAGILAGDFIIKVNNEAIAGMPLTQVVSKVRGDKGTKVSLTLNRAGKEMAFSVVRDTIKVESVETRLDEHLSSCTDSCANVAYLKLNQFGDNTVDEWEQKIAEIKAKWDAGAIKISLASGVVALPARFANRSPMPAKNETANPAYPRKQVKTWKVSQLLRKAGTSGWISEGKKALA